MGLNWLVLQIRKFFIYYSVYGFPLPYDFLNSILFSLAYFMNNAVYDTHNTHHMG